MFEGTQVEFYQHVAKAMGQGYDDDIVSAIEGACITRAEYAADPDACHARIRGALEEIDSEKGNDFYDPLDDFNYVGSRHHY